MTLVEKYAQKWALHIWVSETVSAQPNWSKPNLNLTLIWSGRGHFGLARPKLQS